MIVNAGFYESSKNNTGGGSETQPSYITDPEVAYQKLLDTGILDKDTITEEEADYLGGIMFYYLFGNKQFIGSLYEVYWYVDGNVYETPMFQIPEQMTYQIEKIYDELGLTLDTMLCSLFDMNNAFNWSYPEWVNSPSLILLNLDIFGMNAKVAVYLTKRYFNEICPPGIFWEKGVTTLFNTFNNSLEYDLGRLIADRIMSLWPNAKQKAKGIMEEIVHYSVGGS